MVYVGLEKAAAAIVRPLETPQDQILGLAILTLFLMTALLQSQLPLIRRTGVVSAFYVHARNGFYFNTLANRLTIALWPVQEPRENL